MKKIFLISGLLLFCIGTSIGYLLNRVKQKPATVTIKQVESPVTKKVMVINFNPIIESQNNKRLTEVYSWNNPQTLSNQYIADVKTVSGNYADYQIVDWQDIDDFPVKQNGFDFTDSSFLQCLQNNNCDAGMANYNQILSDYQICEKRNSGEIDELWLWGGPWFGYWEAVMAGPNAFNTNGPPVTGTTCQKQLHIMGFNYERGVPEMLEDLGHRTEGTMRYVYGSWEPQETHPWNRFTLYDKIAPGKAACGNVHYAPNSQSDYDWSNQTVVSSSCEDWLNYPNLTSTKQSFNCSRWNCNGYDYKKWWFNHLPKASGRTNDKWNNWWHYILDFEEAINPPVSPSPSPSLSPSPSASLSPSPSPSVSPDPTAVCSLIFTVAGISCKDLSGNTNVSLNDTITFSCSKGFPSTEAVAYFRALLNDDEYTKSAAVEFGNSDNASWSVKIDKTGDWRIQCRICNNINQVFCTAWGQAN